VKKLISFSVHHPVTVIALLLSLLLLGGIAAFLLPVDYYPAVSSRTLLVSCRYPGIAAGEMRFLVTIPIEDAFASLKGLKTLSSTSRDGLTLLSLELHWGTDIDMALVESREIIDLCYQTLPSGCSKPEVTKQEMGSELILALIPQDGNLTFARYITETDIKSRFQKLPGAGSVSVSGGEEEEIHVLLYRDRLESRQLGLAEAAESLASANFEYPAGTIKEGDRELSVQVSGLFPSSESIAAHPVLFNQGGPVRIGDLGEVVRGTAEKESFFLINGQEGIRLGLRKKPGTSPLTFSMAVKEEIEALKEMYPWCHLEILENPAEGIKTSLIFLLASAGLGLVVTGVVIKYFLNSIPCACLLCGVIPLSAAAALPVLLLAGRSLNTLSLSGLSIGIGMVVDAGAVVIENIRRISEEAPSGNQDFKSLAIRGAAGVAQSNAGSALTTILAFLPVFFIPGLLGELFSDMALAVMASISASCLLSMTYIPCLFSLFPAKLGLTKPPVSPAAKAREPAWIGRTALWYTRYLTKTLRRPVRVLLPLGITLVVGLFSLARLDFSLLPEPSSRILTGRISFPPGTSIAALERRAREIDQQLRRLPFVQALQISGGLEPRDYPRLADPGQRRENLVLRAGVDRQASRVLLSMEAAFPEALWETGGGDLSLWQTGQDLILRGGSPEVLQSPDLPAKITGLLFADSDPPEDPLVLQPSLILSEAVFTPDRLAAARFSISVLQIAEAARTALEGAGTLPLYQAGREIPVVVKFQPQEILTLDDLGNTGILNGESFIPLRALGVLEPEIREKILYRYNRWDAKQILLPPGRVPGLSAEKLNAGLTGGLFGGASGRNQNADDFLSLEIPGALEKKEMLKEGLFLLSLTILLLYLLMGAQFESFFVPLLMLLALPAALCGALFSLVLAGRSLNINGIIALVVLFGVSVNNAIILYESCTEKGGWTPSGILAGCQSKLRALLITNASTILALVPFTLNPGGLNPQASLSLAVIGGLVLSAVLVALILPAGFLLLAKGEGR
jgi:multidrug efflux pump subunit AcrB